MLLETERCSTPSLPSLDTCSCYLPIVIVQAGVELQETKVVSQGVFVSRPLSEVDAVGMLQELEDSRTGYGLGAALHAEFAADVGDMLLHRAQA